MSLLVVRRDDVERPVGVVHAACRVAADARTLLRRRVEQARREARPHGRLVRDHVVDPEVVVLAQVPIVAAVAQAEGIESIGGEKERRFLVAQRERAPILAAQAHEGLTAPEGATGAARVVGET